jgi:VanZ family protein
MASLPQDASSAPEIAFSATNPEVQSPIKGGWLRAYLPVLLWMAVIFMASTDIGSTRHTSRIIGPILRWFKPDVSDQTIKAVQTVVRKTGHLSEYAALGFLIWRGRRIAGARGGWVWREFWIAVGCAGAYACTDEFHQLFVSSRQASIFDVMIDTCGATAGMLLLRWFGGRRRWW